MDFKEDQLALEAYVRMRSNWRDEDEISDEEWVEYANKYMEENPFPDLLLVSGREAMFYNRMTGSMAYFKRIRFTALYWEPGEFWIGMRLSIRYAFSRIGIELPYFPRLRGLGEYFGLIADPDAECADYEDEQV